MSGISHQSRTGSPQRQLEHQPSSWHPLVRDSSCGFWLMETTMKWKQFVKTIYTNKIFVWQSADIITPNKVKTSVFLDDEEVVQWAGPCQGPLHWHLSASRGHNSAFKSQDLNCAIDLIRHCALRCVNNKDCQGRSRDTRLKFYNGPLLASKPTLRGFFSLYKAQQQNIWLATK